jgi:hypothetical protein
MAWLLHLELKFEPKKESIKGKVTCTGIFC